MTHTEALSRFVVDCRMEDFPPKVIDVARTCMLDWIGVTLGAVGDPAVLLLKDTVEEMMEGRPQASILGYGTRTSMANAALVNGMMAHLLDYDDAHSGVRTHPSAPLLPAVVAVAEYLGLSGMDLITAFVVGCEVTLRVGYALGRAYYERGWHATPILGRFGAAAGVSRLLGLGVEQVSAALGLAATQASGLRDAFGTMCKSFHAGKAAMDGLLAALLAKNGFTAPLNILDPESAFGRVFSEEYEPEKIVRDLGKHYYTEGVNFKPYAACLLVHPVIDALVALRQRNSLDSDSIREIHVSVAPVNLQVTGNPSPADSMQAKFSLHMAAALAVVYGEAPDRLFTHEMTQDPRLKALMAKVNAFADGSLTETEAIVRVILGNGREDRIHVDAPKGDPRNPMTFEDVEKKARDLASKALSDDAMDRIVELVRVLEKLENTAVLVRSCCPDVPRQEHGL
jgi:2-methylcitrate dehydratase PrpD